MDIIDPSSGLVISSILVGGATSRQVFWLAVFRTKNGVALPTAAPFPHKALGFVGPYLAIRRI